MCGLWPLNPDADNYTNGLDILARMHTVALPWVDNEFKPDWQHDQEGPKYNFIKARAAAPDRSLLVRAKAAEFFVSSHVIPAQAVAEVVREHKRARANKVTSKPDRKNPDTTYGLSVSQGVIDHAKVNQGHKDIAVQDAITTKQNAETKRVHRRQLKSVTFEKVLHSICCKGFNWSKLIGRGGAHKADELAMALQEWVDDKGYTKGTTVGDNAKDIEKRFKSMRVVLILSMRACHAENRLLVPE